MKRIKASMGKKPDIEEMQNIAREKGGQCLSSEYIHSKSKLRWRCSEGHEWDAIPNSIKMGRWCPICGVKRRAKLRSLGIDEMHELAKKHEGKCLSTEYINNRSKLKWRCSEGHEWEATPHHIKRGVWCPYCAGSIKLTIEEMQTIAIKREGECLSKNYINSQTKLRWRCKEGHEWEARPTSIKRGSWCPYCVGKHQTIEDMQEIARQRGGKCLSTNYINNRTYLRWRCKEGHEWEAKPNYVKLGTWCAICSQKAKLTIDQMKEIAKNRGGECLSTEYINNQYKLKWKCKLGHKWEATPYDVKQGTWCPICSSGISERYCRYVFEKIFDKKFPKRKPKWLTNPRTNAKMELDGYCRELNLAFEYQGIQHYIPRNPYHLSIEEFEQRKKDDELKRFLCHQNEVTLIEIPFSIEKGNIPNYIINECRNRGFTIDQIPVDIFDYKVIEDIWSPRDLEQMRKVAKSRGGKCLSEKYIGTHEKLKWQCKNGHEWETTSSMVKSGAWCPHCAGNVKLTIEEMQKFTLSKGGECLSKKYINSKTKLKWRCKKGHEWEANPNSIKIQGSWCPYCAGRHITIDDMQIIAKKRGGKCLSNEYINAHTKLRWKCKEGHEWMARPNDVKSNKTWCPICARNRKKNQG